MPLTRRTFLKTSLVATALTRSALAADEAPATSARDYLELRAYRFKPGANHTALDGYLEKALIPALNSRGIRAVGVFTEPEPKDPADAAVVWVLIPHATLDSVARVTSSLNADGAVQAAAGDYFAAATKAAPSFERVDSWLLWSFAGQPRLEVPALARAKQARIFEMRTYDSYSETKALNKVEMFNSGEIGAMHEVGLSPVFYGQALTGRDLPHLTYMLCSPDRETHKVNWAAFGKHPTWVKLKADPRYQDNVSKVTSRFLVPATYSQI